MANLINFGILPLTFADKRDYAGIEQGDILDVEVKGLHEQLVLKNQTKGTSIKINLCLSFLEKEMVKAGGKLALIKAKQAAKK